MVSIIVNISVAKVRNIREMIYKKCLVDYKKLLFRYFYTNLQIFIYTPLTQGRRIKIIRIKTATF